MNEQDAADLQAALDGPQAPPKGHGGKRPGAGRKKGHSAPRAAASEPAAVADEVRPEDVEVLADFVRTANLMLGEELHKRYKSFPADENWQKKRADSAEALFRKHLGRVSKYGAEISFLGIWMLSIAAMRLPPSAEIVADMGAYMQQQQQQEAHAAALPRIN